MNLIRHGIRAGKALCFATPAAILIKSLREVPADESRLSQDMNVSYGLSLAWDTIRESKYAVVIIIYLAFFLDNMLLTVVGMCLDFQTFHRFFFENFQSVSVPIIPNVLHATSLKLIPKSAFHDNINNLLADMTEATTQYQIKNISSKFDIVNVQSLNKKMIDDDNEEIESENGPVGVLLSSKALVQLFLNPLVGIWTTRVGYKVPIFFGTVNLLIASLRKRFRLLSYIFFS